MLEDDTLAVEGWYSRAIEVLRKFERKIAGQPGKQGVFMRFFYSEELFGWNSEDWPMYLFLSFLTWIIATSVLIVARGRSRSLLSLLSNGFVVVTPGVCIPALVALFFAAGRNPIWPLVSGVHEMNKNGCYSRGYIYPCSMVEPFLEKTDLATDWLVDMMMEKISDEEGWVPWARTPALLQHIGTTSSKEYVFDNTAGHLCNLEFELNQKSQLGRSN